MLASARAEAEHAISILPSPIGFGGGHGTQLGGGAPGEQQFGFFQVGNTGSKKLNVTDMEIIGPDAALMSFDDPFCGTVRDCGQHFSLAPGEQRAFSVTCTAAQSGVFSASLVVRSNAHTTTVPMSCIGNHPPVIELSQSEFDFGITVACNGFDPCDPNCIPSRPLVQTLRISNTAPAPSELDFYITPNIVRDDNDFTSVDQGSAFNPIVLAAGQFYDFTVSFHPRNFGERGPGPLSVISLFPGQAPISIPFHAEGGGGRLELDVPHDLGPVVFGQTVQGTITGRNTGTTCVTVTGIGVVGDCMTIGTGTLVSTFLPGQSATQDIACTPTGLFGGASQVTAEVPYLDPDVVFASVNVGATGGALVALTPIDFTRSNAVEIGTSATQRTFVDNFGVDALTVVAMTSTIPQFTATLPGASLPVVLGVGESLDVDVTFTPAAEPLIIGGIVFDVTGGGGATLQVVGEGLPPGSGRARQTRGAAAPDGGDAASHAGGCSTSSGTGIPLFLGLACLVGWSRTRRLSRRASAPAPHPGGARSS